ncbi:Auxin transport protein (BIG) isoform 1 [Hibiscus syriacus]|uniref:Auxin transport protein (BIG) isoform 1 n=1 Tax=Hibiscus syriacus TaxID=106335 RepID=A0A6A2Z062_HIBSY|nr:Auxin transport protein (BIG) isoform 1 [Hibiscus syriacus]
MASLSSLELNLSLKPSYVPKTIANLLKDLSNVQNAVDKLVVLNDYITDLEGELSGISAFKRQLPHCMLLLMEALGSLKEEFMKINSGMGPENEGPLMEFLAMKKKSYEGKQVDVSSQDNQNCDFIGKGLMSSSPHLLWNTKQHKAFQDFIRASYENPNPFEPSSSRFASVNGTTNVNGAGGLNPRTGDGTLSYNPKPPAQPNGKNNRRSWSHQLHARFLEALRIIGGVDVATPKQIREVMQVEGLTNDQVKSHLQKYRLHCRRVPENKAQGSGNYQDPWAPPNILRRPFKQEGSFSLGCRKS